MSLTRNELEGFVRELVATRDRWEHLIRHADDERVYELVWEDEDVNAWVICWSEDQDTGFHDHDVSGAAIAVISGQIREDRLRIGSDPHTRLLGAGDVFSVAPAAIHRVLHEGDRPSVTIHAYSPPLTRTGAYHLTDDGELQRQALSIEEELRAESIGPAAGAQAALS